MSLVFLVNYERSEISWLTCSTNQRAPWDGWAEDVTFPGQFKDYYYPNQQNARMLWYHDHALGKVSGLPLVPI